MSKTYYLKDNNDMVIAKFEQPKDDIFSGITYMCESWDGKTNEPLEWSFHSEVYAKWDGCSHWWFRGEDYNLETEEKEESYYHICSSFQTFILIMCFVWKIAGEYHKEDLTKRHILSSLTTEEYDLELIDYMLKDYKIERVDKE